MGSDREMENVGAGWGEVSTCGPPGACAQSVGASSHGAVCKCGAGQGSMGKQVWRRLDTRAGHPQGLGAHFLVQVREKEADRCRLCKRCAG